MNENNQELDFDYRDCFNQLSSAYEDKLDEIKELKNYITLLQCLCNHHKIIYPPLEIPFNF